jgi:hypothetical protein
MSSQPSQRRITPALVVSFYRRAPSRFLIYTSFSSFPSYTVFSVSPAIPGSFLTHLLVDSARKTFVTGPLNW